MSGAGAKHSVPRLDSVVAFAVEWAPHGGGSAVEIESRFGMSVTEFYRRVLAILSSGDEPTQLSPVVRDRVMAVARRRIWLGQ